MRCDLCVRLRVVCFIGCLVISALLMYFLCEFGIVHTSLHCVLELWCGLHSVVHILQAEAQLFSSCGMWRLGVNDCLK